MTDWTRSTVPAGVLVALALSSLGGCGGAPKPAPVDDPPVSASSSPTGAPTLPAEAKGTTPEAAEAFVRYYMQVLSAALQSNDTRTLRSISSPTCLVCTKLERLVSTTYGAGGFIHGDGFSVGDLDIDGASTPSRVVLRGSVVQHPQDFKKTGTTPTKHTPEGPLPSVFVVTRENNSWMLSNWERT